jgi:translation initiation factor 1 (eIF-1/SUI1)
MSIAVSAEVVIRNLTNADLVELSQNLSRVTGNSVTCKDNTLQINGGTRQNVDSTIQRLQDAGYDVREIHQG